MARFLRERSFRRLPGRGHVRSRSRSDPGLSPGDALIRELKTKIGAIEQTVAAETARIAADRAHDTGTHGHTLTEETARVLALIDPRANRPRPGEPLALRATWPFAVRVWNSAAQEHVCSAPDPADPTKHELGVVEIFIALVETPPLAPAQMRPGCVFEVRPLVEATGAPRCEFKLYLKG